MKIYKAKSIGPIILMGVLIIASCKSAKTNDYLTDLVNKDVPTFLHALPSLSHNDMLGAFGRVNKKLNYGPIIDTAKIRTLEASTAISSGKLLIDGQLTLLASKLLSDSPENEYAITLLIYPKADTAALTEMVIKNLPGIKRTPNSEYTEWQLNGWILRQKNNALTYFAPSKKIIDALNGEDF